SSSIAVTSTRTWSAPGAAAPARPSRTSARPAAPRWRWPRRARRDDTIQAFDPRPEETSVSNAINWTQVHTRPMLMIPGPTELPWPVVQALNQPATIQYDRSFDETVLEPTTLALRQVFQTKNEVLLMPGSGRTALEAGALSVIEPGDRVLVV